MVPFTSHKTRRIALQCRAALPRHPACQRRPRFPRPTMHPLGVRSVRAGVFNSCEHDGTFYFAPNLPHYPPSSPTSRTAASNSEFNSGHNRPMHYWGNTYILRILRTFSPPFTLPCSRKESPCKYLSGNITFMFSSGVLNIISSCLLFFVEGVSPKMPSEFENLLCRRLFTRIGLAESRATNPRQPGWQIV